MCFFFPLFFSKRKNRKTSKAFALFPLTSSRGNQPFPVRRNITAVNFEILSLAYNFGGSDALLAKLVAFLDKFAHQVGWVIGTSMYQPDWLDDMHREDFRLIFRCLYFLLWRANAGG